MQFLIFQVLKIAVLMLLYLNFSTFWYANEGCFQAFRSLRIVAIVYSLILIIGIILSINYGFLWLLILPIANLYNVYCNLSLWKRFVYL